MSGKRALLVAIALALSAGIPLRSEAQRLGRLFTSVEQRAILDEIREQARLAQPELEAEPEPESEPVARVADAPLDPLVSKLTVNGIVRRSGGRTSVWVNGAEIERGGHTREGVAVEATRVTTDDVVRLRLPSGTQSIALRPGQEIDVRSGLVLEPYEKSSDSANSPSAFATPLEATTPEPAAGDTRPDAPTAAPPGAAAGLPSAQAPLPTGAQQAASDNAIVPDIVKQLRAIGKLSPQQQAEALAKLSAANSQPKVVPMQQQQQ